MAGDVAGAVPGDAGAALDRRRFLVGALAVAGLVAGCTADRAAPRTTTPPPATPAPSAPASATPTGHPVDGTIGIAVLGAGGHGTGLARRLAGMKGAAVLAVCDPDSARANALAGRVEQRTGDRPEAVADLRRALEDPRIDAVVVATPHHWHVLAAVWALEAGKHVYLEKPATHSLAEGAPLLDAWRRAGLVVEVGTQRRSHPGLQEAIAAAHDGAIGQVTHATCYSWKRRPPIGPQVRGRWPKTLDEELWFGPRSVRRPTRERFHYDWHWFTDFGNGGLGNNGVHRLDVARWGMRLPPSGDRTLSWAGRLGPKDAGQTPNTALTVVSFGARSVAHDLRGLPAAPDRQRDPGLLPDDEVVFRGDGAAIVVSRTAGRLVDERGRVVQRFGADAGDIDPLRRHLAGFLRAVHAGDPGTVAVGPEEGTAAAAMCHAPAAAHAHPGAGPADPDEVADQVAALCGTAMDQPMASFAAHVSGTGDARAMVFSGTRRIADDAVAGAPESLRYRSGYQLP